MSNSDNSLAQAGQRVVDAINALLGGSRSPVVVALDGGSGAGKSTLASFIQSQFDAVVIPLDDFFSANIPDARWDEFTVEERLSQLFDWRRLRQSALEPLRAGKRARWQAFDFQAGLQPDGTYRMQENPVERRPARVILLEGAYSAHPTLGDLIDFAILMDVPVEIRHQRLASREDKKFLRLWHNRWDPVEDYYFSRVRLTNSYELVVTPA